MNLFLLEYIIVEILNPSFSFTYLGIFINQTYLLWGELCLTVSLLFAFIKFHLVSIKLHELFVNLGFKTLPEKFNYQFFTFHSNEFITSVFLRFFKLVYCSEYSRPIFNSDFIHQLRF